MRRTLILTPYPFQEAARWARGPVITPNSRAAGALGVPPETLESLAHRLLMEAGLTIASPLSAHALLRQAVEEALAPGDGEGMAGRIAPTLREVLRAGVDLDALERAGSPRAGQIARIARLYHRRLRQAGQVDAAEALWEAARLASARWTLRVYGYARLGAGEQAFLDAAAGDGSEVILPYAGHPLFADTGETAERLRERGWRVEQPEREPAGPGERLAGAFVGGAGAAADARAHVYPHLEAEVRGTLAQIKLLLTEGAAPDEIALVARDDAFYGPTVLAVAWEYGVPVQALYAVPLGETRLGSWIRLLLETGLERFPFEATVRLLNHSRGPGLTPAQWQEARKRHPSGQAAWEKLGVDLAELAWPHRGSRGEYVRRLHAILERDAMRQRAGQWAREIIALSQLEEGLAEMVRLPDEAITGERFREEVLEALTLLTVPAQPGRGGVELHTPLSLFGARCRHVFVMGAAEGRLPAPIRDDEVLDFHERRSANKSFGLHLEGAAEAARREALSFYALLQTAAETVTISYPRLSEGREALPSPFLLALGLNGERPPAFPPASPEEARRVYLRQPGLDEDDVLPHARHAWAVERQRESSEPPDEYDGVVGLPLDPGERVFSASQLTALGQCPFRWFAGHLLRLTEPEEAGDDLGPRLKGQLYHRALQRGMRRGPGGEGRRQAILLGLEEAFRQAEQDLNPPPLPAWEARRTELLDQLRAAVEADQFMPDEAEVLALEAEFETEWSGLRVRGIVDRIDGLPDGLILVDYKTGAQLSPGIKDADGRARLDLQLPLYRDAAAPALFPGQPVIGARYFSLAQGKEIRSASDEEVLAGLPALVRGHLMEGRYPVEPDIDQKVCGTCPFDLVCRRGPRLSRKGGGG